MPREEAFSEVFAVIAAYCERQGWVPVGFREFQVGHWHFTMNGTGKERDGVPQYHCAVRDTDDCVLVLVNPFGGVVTGLSDRAFTTAEQEIIAALGNGGDDAA